MDGRGGTAVPITETMNPSDSAFHPTRWTLVLRSRGQGEDAKVALSDLCAAYYEPVVAFLRREGRDEDAAREMAHAFFEGCSTGGVGAPDPGRGRFRSYLLGALKHFLSKHRDAALAGKRGGGAEHVPLVTETDTSPGLPMPGLADDTLAFDREWALTLIARALAALEGEHARQAGAFRHAQALARRRHRPRRKPKPPARSTCPRPP